MKVNKIIFGLGNFEKRYSLTRHNFGDEVLKYLTEEYQLKFKKHKICAFSTLTLNDKNILLVKSLTYINLSGEVMECLKKKIKFFPGSLLVLVDDANLPFGKLRFRKNGSAGGHKGLKSIISYLGNNNFFRLRLGVGNEEKLFNPLEKFVLEKFNCKEQEILPQIISGVISGLKIFLEDEEKGANYWNNFNLNIL